MIESRKRKEQNMNGRYCLADSRRVPNAGYQPIRVAIPVQHEMVNDLCLCCRGSMDFIALNKSVLRQALLDNPELTKELLGVIVKDAFAPEPEAPKKEKKVVEPKKEEVENG